MSDINEIIDNLLKIRDDSIISRGYDLVSRNVIETAICYGFVGDSNGYYLQNASFNTSSTNYIKIKNGIPHYGVFNPMSYNLKYLFG